MLNPIIACRLSDSNKKLFEELEGRGGVSSAKKYHPLLAAGVARKFTHLGTDHIVSCLHPQVTFMLPVPPITRDLMDSEVQKSCFDAGNRLIAKWVLGISFVSADSAPFICKFFKRHSGAPAIYSVPHFFAEEFLEDAKKTGVDIHQISVDYKNVTCPICDKNNEIRQDLVIANCAGCGAEFSAN